MNVPSWSYQDHLPFGIEIQTLFLSDSSSYFQYPTLTSYLLLNDLAYPSTSPFVNLPSITSVTFCVRKSIKFTPFSELILQE